MPINKDALKRFRIIDRLLSDPNHDYTTAKILREVNLECDHDVTLRMIQKDINAIQEEFGKDLVRNAGGRGTVRYADQSQPIFYQELTPDEEEVLREVLKTLGQFDGLDNFSSLELMKKKLEVPRDGSQQPLICFSNNDILQMPATLLGRLFTAISRKKIIKISYTVFGGKTREHVIYPYQLKQYNDRWFLLATPLATEEFPYDPEFIATFALDRIGEKFEYVDDRGEYIESPVNFNDRFNEIVGVTLRSDAELEDITFAVRPASVQYVRTKWMHATQIEIEGEDAARFREQYPTLRDCAFFSIECRPNYELYSRLASFGANVIVLEPTDAVEVMRKMMANALANYSALNEKNINPSENR